MVGAALTIAFGCVFGAPQALLDLSSPSRQRLLFGAATGCWLAVLRDGARSAGLAAGIYGALILSFLIPSIRRGSSASSCSALR